MKAFSLIELLVSLIIISIIMAALASVISKKLQYNNLTYSRSSVETNCAKFDNNCLVCTNKGCALCANQFSVEAGYYINPEDSCEVKKCSNECTTCTNNGCTACKEGYGYDANNMSCTKCAKGTYSLGGINACQECPNGTYSNTEGNTSCSSCSSLVLSCSDCDSKTGSCITCQNGNKPDSQGKCATEAACLKVGNICIAKYNAGDTTNYDGLEIPLETLGINEGNSVSNVSANTCLIENKYSTGCTYSIYYGGCYRTICTWDAANKICAYHGWRLPTGDELEQLGSNLYIMGRDSLSFCSYRDNDVRYESCYGYEKSAPYSIWSSTSHNGHYRYYALYLGPTIAWSYNTSTATYLRSVRCVRDL